MKLVKKFLLAALFVSAISATTFAGDMETPGFAPPPPPPSHSMSSTVSSGAEASSDATETAVINNTSDALLYDALMTLLSLY